MTFFLQLVVSGLINGCLYALLAVGIAMIFKATQIVNFAQGELFMLGAYVHFLGMLTALRLPFLPALALSLAAAAVTAALAERLVCRPLLGAPIVSVVIATIGVSFILKGGVRLVWGSVPLPFRPLFETRTVMLGGLVVSTQGLVIICTGLGLLGLLYVFFQFTKLGKMMRATSENRTAAVLMGINVKRMFSLAWALSAVLAAVGGILIGPLVQLEPEMGIILIAAFAALIIGGGFGNLAGAAVGGMLLGVVENLVSGYISTALQSLTPFVLIVVVLAIRPTGLFGRGEVYRSHLVS